MKLLHYMRLLAVVMLAGVLVGFPFTLQEAQARGGGFHGGGFHGGGFGGGGGFHGGFGGGSFRPEGVHPEGVHPEGRPGGRPGEGPGEGRHQPDRPWDDGRQPDYRRNDPNINVDRNVNVSGAGGGWGPYYGGGSGWGAAAAGAVAGLAVGSVVGSLSSASQPMIVNNQNYYYDQGNYYQPCYQGTDSSYCVVPNPNE